MPTISSGNRVFISCVSDEFEMPGSAFPGLRGQLRHYLARANCEVKVQEEFSQHGDADLIRIKFANWVMAGVKDAEKAINDTNTDTHVGPESSP